MSASTITTAIPMPMYELVLVPASYAGVYGTVVDAWVVEDWVVEGAPTPEPTTPTTAPGGRGGGGCAIVDVA
jgi:hypothetical protein